MVASMRWLLCGGDGSKKKKRRLNFFYKSPTREFIHITVLIIRKKTALNYSHYRFNSFETRLTLHHAVL